MTVRAGTMIAFDLDGLAVPGEGGMQAKVLADTGAARVVLVVLAAGAEVPEQRAPSQLLVQGLRGHAVLQSGGTAQAVTSGTLLLIEERVAHRLRAVEDAALLLTYTPSPAQAGEDTTPFAGLPAYVARQAPATPPRPQARAARRTLPVLRPLRP